MLNKLEWDEKFSVGVELIDSQHKMMFKTINHLIDVLRGLPKAEELNKIISDLVEYKKYHFATEEKYFVEFGYERTAEHTEKHKMFSEKLELLTRESNGNTLVLAFGLVDFLEDWLIDHLMVEDQKYVACFREHGLK